MSKAADVIHLLEDNGSESDKLASEIESTIKGIFPNSYIESYYSSHLHPSITIRFTLGKGKEEWANGIIQNDPAFHVLMVDGMDKEGTISKPLTLERSHGSVMIKPEDRYMAYGRLKIPFRKVTGDKAAIVKGVKGYFERLKKALQGNKDKLTDQHLELVGSKF